jgi:hypothetical protein
MSNILDTHDPVSNDFFLPDSGRSCDRSAGSNSAPLLIVAISASPIEQPCCCITAQLDNGLKTGYFPIGDPGTTSIPDPEALRGVIVGIGRNPSFMSTLSALIDREPFALAEDRDSKVRH